MAFRRLASDVRELQYDMRGLKDGVRELLEGMRGSKDNMRELKNKVYESMRRIFIDNK